MKAKVGIGDDAGRLAAVRAVLGADVAIRLDANGAWSTDEATAAFVRSRRSGSNCARSPSGASPRRESSRP